MKNSIIIALLFFISTTNAQKHFEIEGVKVPRTLELNHQELQLNGYGSRSKMFFEIYIQALYTTHFLHNAKDVINSNTTMAIRIQILSSLISSKKFSKAFDKGLKRSVGEEGMKNIQNQANLLEKLITVEETKKGDSFNLIYNSKDEHLWVFKNDELKGKIPGFDFKKAFFGIWLSDNPVDEHLKQDLLGY